MGVKKEEIEQRSLFFVNYLKESKKALVPVDQFYKILGFEKSSAYYKANTLVRENLIGMFRIYNPKNLGAGKTKVYLFNFDRTEEAKREVSELVKNFNCEIVESEEKRVAEKQKSKGTFYDILITKSEFETYKGLKKNYVKRTEISKRMGIQKLVLINGVINAELGKFKEV